MKLDLGLKQGFRLGSLKVDPLAHEVHTPEGTRPLSDLSVAFLLQLAEAPGQTVETAVLRERLGLDSSQPLEESLHELERAFGEQPAQPHYIAQEGEGYRLVTDVLIDVPPMPTTSQILHGIEDPEP